MRSWASSGPRPDLWRRATEAAPERLTGDAGQVGELAAQGGDLGERAGLGPGRRRRFVRLRPCRASPLAFRQPGRAAVMAQASAGKAGKGGASIWATMHGGRVFSIAIWIRNLLKITKHFGPHRTSRITAPAKAKVTLHQLGRGEVNTAHLQVDVRVRDPRRGLEPRT